MTSSQRLSPNGPNIRRACRSRALYRTAVIALLTMICCTLSVADSTRAEQGAPGVGQRPSLMLIVVDTWRRDYAGCYGFAGAISPNIDGFAAQALRFENCYAPSSFTKPSVASLITGVSPLRHGLTQFTDADQDRLGGAGSEALAAGALTLAERLQLAGYRCAGFSENQWLSPELGFAQGYDHYETIDIRAQGSSAFDRGLAWLKDRADKRPFFLMLHLMDVHGPYKWTAGDLEALRGSASLGPSMAMNEAQQKAFPKYLSEQQESAAHDDLNDVRSWRVRYAGGVRGFDRKFGRFLAALKGSGLFDDSAIVVTADHGEALGEHNGWNHGFSHYYHQVRIPLLLKLPEGQQCRADLSEPVSLVDLYPSLLGLAGISAAPGDIDGRDLCGRGPQAGNGNRPIVIVGTKPKPGLLSIVAPPYKLIWDYPAGVSNLFRIDTDSNDTNDLAAVNPAVVKTLKDQLTAFVSAAGAKPSLRELRPASGREHEALRSLGYLK